MANDVSPTDAKTPLKLVGLGRPADRVEGRLKVTGGALYTGDHALPRHAYAVLLESTIPSGKVLHVDQDAARRAPGFIGIISCLDAPKFPPVAPKGKKGDPPPTEARKTLQSADIVYNGQPLGVVVAATWEEARYAASLVRVAYAPSPAIINASQQGEATDTLYPKERFGVPIQGKRGDPDQAFKNAATIVEATYTTPIEHHHPMEPHATLVEWDQDRLTVYETTQYINGVQTTLGGCFGLDPKSVHVISHFVGGGFGSKGSTWQHTVIAAMAARQFKRPIKLVLSRQNMAMHVGHRSRTSQAMRAAADGNGKLLALAHHVDTDTSHVLDFIESSSVMTRMLYNVKDLDVSHRLVRRNLPTPTFMRAPGEASGSFALESMMDELAVKLRLDPVELRQRNDALVDLDSGKAFSSKHLSACFERGAELFGWAKRHSDPRSMREGDELVGYGVAAATYPANRQGASAQIVLSADGRAIVTSATHEMGQGNYTAMTQVAAAALGLPVTMVRFELGDSAFPAAPVSGGSMTAASVGPAVLQAAQTVSDDLRTRLCAKEGSLFHGQKPTDLRLQDGQVMNAGGQSLSLPAALKQLGLAELKASATTTVAKRDNADAPCRAGDLAADCYAFHSFGAQFVEVRVAPATGQIRVARVVGVYDVGRILNQKMARSQGLGGIIMGLGMALMEETPVDPRDGRLMARNLSDYRVPVHADCPQIEIEFIDAPDLLFNPLGCRGVGEIPIVGIAAAVANGVYHATGIRLRDLPLTPDKLVDAGLV